MLDRTPQAGGLGDARPQATQFRRFAPKVCSRAFSLLACVGVACSGGSMGGPNQPGAGPGATVGGVVGEGATPGGGGAPAGGGGAPVGGGGAPTGGGGGNPGSPGLPPQPGVFQAAPAALRKLTVLQYQNVVRDLLGADIQLPQELEPDSLVNGSYAVGAAKATISPSAQEKFESAAFALAAQVLDERRRDAFVGCKPTAIKDSACTTAFITRFGRRAFRRPLTSTEVARYVALAENAQTALGNYHTGLEFALAGLLQSPHLLFRVELGSEQQGGVAARAYDGYELATRLSFLFWNSQPDDVLLDAAAAGGLKTLGGLTAQAERLLGSPRAKQAMSDFHSERLMLEDLHALEKEASVFQGLDDGLRNAMVKDVLSTIEELSFADGPRDFRTLFDTRVVFVNAKLAQLYGLPAVTGISQRVELPVTAKRIGLLGKVGFLAANAHANSTSPTKRGKYIREQLLCQGIPAPPPNVVTVLPEPDPSAPTMRDRLKTHGENPSCATCHSRMDPLGLSLEHFDAIGRYRADDKGHALDTSGELDGQAFDGEVELSQLLRDDPRTSECLARQLYRYTVAHVETQGEAPAISALVQSFTQSQYDFKQLLRAVVVSDGFRYTTGE